MQEMISGRTDIAGHPAIPVLINYVRRDARRVYRELKKKNLLQCETDFDRVICAELQRENFYERLSKFIGLRAARRIDMFLNKYSCL